MEIKNKIFENILLEALGDKYNIYEYKDTQKYIFAFYKHLDYEFDDDRGMVIGYGPIAYNKNTDNYKLLGSGDLVTGDYLEYLNKGSKKDEYNPDEIFFGIIRRNFVNESDIAFLIFYLQKKIGKFKYELRESPDGIEYFEFESKNIKAISYLRNFFDRLSFRVIQNSTILRIYRNGNEAENK